VRRPPEVDDAGSAVVDFVLVSALLLVVFLAVAQAGVVLHTRNVLVAAAAEGARHGANADRTPEQGVERTRQVVAEALSPDRAAALEVLPRAAVTPEGLDVLEIEVTTPLPVVFLPVGPLRLTVRGHALEESR
jgi:hypothetical protein